MLKKLRKSIMTFKRERNLNLSKVSKKISCLIMVLCLTSSILVPLSNMSMIYDNIKTNDDIQIPKESSLSQETNSLTYKYEWGLEDAIHEEPTPPNIKDILDNVTSFQEENHTVYLGDEVIPDSLMEGTQWVKYQVNLSAMYIKDDMDPLDAGEVYIRWIPNYWIGMPEYDLNNNWDNYQWKDELSFDHDLYNELGPWSISDATPQWSNFSQPVTLFEDWTVMSSMYLQILDEDALADDIIGGLYWQSYNPSSLLGYYEFSLLNVDLAMTFTILDTDTTFTANNLTELYQPFLFDNDDTDHTREPEIVAARLIQGFDPAINRNAFCIQYIYYWSEAWRQYSFWPDEKIHDDDYEMVQIYINFSYTGDKSPYRYVFDNQDTYFDTPTGWRTDQKYSIYEVGATDENINAEIPISEELQPLLGETYNISYFKRNLSEYSDQLAGAFGGVPTLMLTINTSYHQLALGRVTSLDIWSEEAEILGQLTDSPKDLIPISTVKVPLTNSNIYVFYDRLNLSLTQGFHTFEGEEVPNFAPFTYDVLQVFTEPYIHSSYDFIMQNAINHKDDTESKGGFLNVQRSVNLTYTVPLKTNVDLPNILTPGQNLTAILETLLDEDNAILTIDYMFNITANYSLFFIGEQYFETVIQNQIVIDFSNPIVQLANDYIEFLLDKTFSADIGSYVTIDVLLTPQLIGEIVNCNITVHLIEILKYLWPSAGAVLKFFFDDIYLKINPILSGYLDADVKLGNSSQSISWDTDDKDFNLDLKIPDLSYGDNLTLELENFTYGINFLIDWYVGYDSSWFLKLFIGDGDEYLLGQYPNVNIDLAPLQSDVKLRTWLAGTSTWYYEAPPSSDPGSGDPDTTPPDGVPGYDLVIYLGAIFAISIIYYKKK